MIWLFVGCMIGLLVGASTAIIAPELNFSFEYVDWFLELPLGIFIFVISIFLHIVIHEVGHLLMGLVSGYRFVGLSILGYMVVKNPQNKLEFKRFKVPGIGGQCLMAPPEYSKDFAYKRYLLGGILANGVAIIICSLFIKWNLFSWIFIIVGAIVVLTNGIPMQFNDGKSVQLMAKDETNRKLMYVALKANALLYQGYDYTEMNEEYFLPLNTVGYSYLNTQHDIMRVNYFLNRLDFREAHRMLEDLWRQKNEISVPIFKTGIEGELLSVLCYLNPTDQRISELWNNSELQHFLKQPLMGNYRIKASYAKSEGDTRTAIDLLKASLDAQQNMPSAGDAKMEVKLAKFLLSKW
ncbi:hypothetical protein RU97_GL001294 [Enterococcus canis]|uniref:Peptidase M50 domain-containing protein n=2 Tax=Enterococcus canis TaxID=214095 RepID=A0A1L8RB11_9ENTE|nr:hypothetical protein [Enterococcus canis]OJG16970.1 hypothetical protein RU97_GL001294 [Enterococcus canis]